MNSSISNNSSKLNIIQCRIEVVKWQLMLIIQISPTSRGHLEVFPRRAASKVPQFTAIT
jgi:hypothetical protein